MGTFSFKFGRVLPVWDCGGGQDTSLVIVRMVILYHPHYIHLNIPGNDCNHCATYSFHSGLDSSNTLLYLLLQLIYFLLYLLLTSLPINTLCIRYVMTAVYSSKNTTDQTKNQDERKSREGSGALHGSVKGN